MAEIFCRYAVPWEMGEFTKQLYERDEKIDHTSYRRQTFESDMALLQFTRIS